MMKSDHPVMDSRFLIFEAQQAYYYGLPQNLALASVTTNSAKTMGMDHRIGYVKKGWDAGNRYLCTFNKESLTGVCRPSYLGLAPARSWSNT